MWKRKGKGEGCSNKRKGRKIASCNDNCGGCKLTFSLPKRIIFVEGSRQSCPSVESLPSAFSFSLRGPSYSRTTGPSSHIFTLHSHPPLSTGLNPATGGVNPYSTPLPHYTANHAPSPPPYNLGCGGGGGALGAGGVSESQESCSPKLLSREGPYGLRSSLRYNTFQQSMMSNTSSSTGPPLPSYPPPPPPAPTAPLRFSPFQQISPALIQAEAALWGEQRRNDSAPSQSDKKSRGEIS